MQKIIILLFITYSTIFAQSVAIAKSITGIVKVKRDNKIIDIKKGNKLHNGDIVITKDKSSIGIIFDDGSRLSLGSKTLFVINKFIVKPSLNRFDVDIELKKGKALFSSGKVGKLAPKSVKFRVPEGVIGIRGTEFLVEVE
jgi:hypothetical protein